MATYHIGQRAELAAAEHLKARGYKIIERNWRTKWCEIDIVAKRNDTMYFVEVKYRSSESQGTGLDYITSQKLRQMRFAAEFWVQAHNFNGNYQLAVVAVGGESFIVTDLLTEL